MHWILGYGSLVHREGLSRFLGRQVDESNSELVKLKGYRREWNVAYDNLEIVGRYFECPFSGERLPCAMTFLNIERDKDVCIDCLAFSVSEDELALMDKKETRYDRIKIESGVIGDPKVAGDIWVYVAKPVAVRCFESAASRGETVISADYMRTVQQAYRQFGIGAYKRFVRSTGVVQSEIRELVAKRAQS